MNVVWLNSQLRMEVDVSGEFKELDIFIEGELIDLCIPTLEFAKNSLWYSWFNNSRITRFLEQGIFPNTPELQMEFFETKSKSRVIFIVKTKKGNYKGVVSLSNINRIEGKCDIAIVIDNSVEFRLSPYVAQEAMALITEYAFDTLGINRIFAGQHIAWVGCQQRMELLGYRIEGIHHQAFRKGRAIGDAMSMACRYEHYKQIVESRGRLWDSYEIMKERMSRLPKKPFAIVTSEFLIEEGGEYYSRILSL